MKAFKENNKTLEQNFIGGWYINKKVCDNVIKYFENNHNKIKGLSGDPEGVSVYQPKVKESLDLIISPTATEKPIVNYHKELFKVLEEYKTKYIYSDQIQEPYGLTDNWNIQKYRPGGGYFKWHFERYPYPATIRRHLVFMTYLNDVTDKGETEFYYQKLKVKPEKGLTLIWPSEWPWTHRGLTSKTQFKYIATGWFCYV